LLCRLDSTVGGRCWCVQEETSGGGTMETGILKEEEREMPIYVNANG
jgi:hypothetical protein